MSNTKMNCGRCKTEVDEDEMCGHCAICEIHVCRSCAHTWHGDILCETCHEENDTCSCDDCLCDECGEANRKVCGCNVFCCDGCNEDIEYDMTDDKGGICLDCYRCADCGCECEEQAPKNEKCDKCYKKLDGGDNDNWGKEHGDYKTLCDVCYDEEEDQWENELKNKDIQALLCETVKELVLKDQTVS